MKFPPSAASEPTDLTSSPPPPTSTPISTPISTPTSTATAPRAPAEAARHAVLSPDPSTSTASTAQPTLDSARLWPRRIKHLRHRGYSLRIDVRSAALTAAVVTAAVVIAAWSLATGSSAISPGQTWNALWGQADTATTRIVIEWRLPRVLFALLAGAALALSGAIFQRITRNPLGSPDIIGFSNGAYTGALVVSLSGATSLWAPPLGALLGGLGTGVLVYTLARGVGRNGLRLVIVGIGVSVLLGSLNTYLLTVMRLEEAIAAASWIAGSLNDVTWVQVWPVAALMVLASVLLIAHGRESSLLQMGDDAARSIGIRAERTRVLLLLAAIALVAVVTAAVGPVSFIALAAPQLAMRLTRTYEVRAVPAAATGAALLVSCDFIARAAFAPLQVPVGIVTLCLGGAYLMWLLIGMGRRSRT